MSKPSTQHRHYLNAKQPQAIEISDLMDVEFEDDGTPVSLYEVDEDNDIWGVAIYVLEEASAQMRKRMLDALMAGGFDDTIETEIIQPTNWVAKTLRQLAPVRAGRFLVHGSHDLNAPRFNDIGIQIDAGLAFGSGHHGTTAGCLDMLGDELKRRRFHNSLDLGTGSGVLAIALAKACKLDVLATDIDPVSTIVARDNARQNGTGALVTCVAATGFNHNEIRNRAPFDLVIANILARPLQMMAPDFANHLAPDARVILSGLLPHQKARIVAAYRMQSMRFIKAHIRDGWLTLVLEAQ